MSEQITTDAARAVLAAAIKYAEQSLLRFIASGQLKHSVAADPYTALVALATAAVALIEGGTVEVELSDILQVMDFIATDPAYRPDPRFPFDKAQFAAALNKEA
ncbi:MAG TPA: hypothetical protein VH593_02705 [Ktedonobacteraceae bacterium]|jgi:hypothetical protein